MSDTDEIVLSFDYEYRPTVRDLTKGSLRVLLDILNKDRELHHEHLAGIAKLAPWFATIPATGSPETLTPFWNNDWFQGLDGMSLYYFIATRKPPVYMEVGSGNSTKFARKAITDHQLDTQIISIDPQPRADIDRLCDKVIRQRCEDVDTSVFESLDPRSILFIDNSHRSFQGSDVTVFFTEILPVLPKGLLFGVHDIFLPLDYPENWLARFYNEQYLLMSYLYGGSGGGRIEFPVAHLIENKDAENQLRFLSHGGFRDISLVGGAFWMER